jgi:hypothetical protein
MAIIEKELQGKINLVGSADVGGNTYNFILPTVIGTALPNVLDNQVIEEVYLICNDTLGNITINLPSIALFNNAWNVKIYVIKTAGLNSTIVNPYSTEVGTSDTLNGYPFKSLVINDAYYLHIVDDNMWMALYCSAPRD